MERKGGDIVRMGPKTKFVVFGKPTHKKPYQQPDEELERRRRRRRRKRGPKKKGRGAEVKICVTIYLYDP